MLTKIREWLRPGGGKVASVDNLPDAGRERPDYRGYGFPGTFRLASETVRYETAVTWAAFWGCVLVLAEDIAKVPWRVMEGRGRGAQDAPDDALNELLDVAFNPEVTAFEGKQFLMHHALTGGNGYCEIEFNRRREPVALWPVSWDRCRPWRAYGQEEVREYGTSRLARQGELVYQVTNATNSLDPSAGTIYLAASNMFHVRGMGFDGLQGYSPITVARKAIAGGLAHDTFGNSFFGNNAVVGTVLQFPGEVGEEESTNIKDSFVSNHVGTENAHRPLILENGGQANWPKVSMEDAQFIEGKEYGLLDMCRVFRVPPHKLAQYETPRAANLEGEERRYIGDSLMPWAVRHEQEAQLKLLGAQRRRSHSTRFVFREILRADTETRTKQQEAHWRMGALNADEIRAEEGRPPLPGGVGQTYFVQLNLQPSDQAADGQPARRTVPAADAAADQAAQVAAHRSHLVRHTFATMAARVVAREAARLTALNRSHGRQPADFHRLFAKWVAEKHRPYLAQELGAAVGAVCEAHGVEASPQLLAGIADAHLVALETHAQRRRAGDAGENKTERAEELRDAVEAATVEFIGSAA